MKTLNECLDHVLQTLIDNGGTICLMCIDRFNSSVPQENHYNVTNEYYKMFTPLGLNDGQFVELLQILKDNEYVKYDVLEIQPHGYSSSTLKAHSAIWFKNLVTGNITNESSMFVGYKILFDSKTVHLKQCQKVIITLKGKFYSEQGGFQGEIDAKNAEKTRIQKQDNQIRLLTLFLAIGSIGVLIIEAVKFLLDYVY